MKHLLLVTLTAMAFAAATAGDEHQHMRQHSPLFDRLKSLVGVWNGKDEQGNPVTVTYRIVSDSSALMETMDMGEKEGVMITMYHPDDDALMVTHYCSMGNQPRMKCSRVSDDGNTLRFSYVDATNLASPDADRMETLAVLFKDPDHFAQEWTARMKGELMKPSVFQYTRRK
jgi:hypothetical protein